MSAEQAAVLDRLTRAQTWAQARASAHQVVALLCTMRAERMPLPSWCRGALRVRR